MDAEGSSEDDGGGEARKLAASKGGPSEFLVTLHIQLRACVSPADAGRWHMQLQDVPAVTSVGVNWADARDKLQAAFLTWIKHHGK